MTGRGTNVGILIGLAIAFVSGVVAFGLGSSSAVVVAVHGAAGLALVVLAPWKSVIARRGLARRRRGSRASLALTALVIVALGAGFAHSSGLARSLGPLTAMQVHVGAAILSLPLAVWHLTSRRVRMRPTDLSRRGALRAGLVSVGAAFSYISLEGLFRALSLPGEARRYTGSFETGSFSPGEMPVTQWLDDSVPEVDPSSWRLRISAGGRVSEFDYRDLEKHTDRLLATIDCTGGWYAQQHWEGVWLNRLLGDADGSSVVVGSVTGFSRRFPLDDVPRILLATRVGNRALSAGHGFPARIVAPGRRGFWWVKWVDRIEVSDAPWWLQSPFPLT